MKKDRDAYIVLAPVGKAKTYSIAARRIGSKERYSVVATCASDTVAQQIVDGLKTLQGEVVEIETVVQRTLADVRAQLTAERERSSKISVERRDLQLKLGVAEREARNAIRERDAAQKVAREEPQRHMTSNPT